MPTRLLRDWTDSEAVNALSAEAERFFVRLIQKADDFGRYTGDPKLLRPYLFPLLLDSTREVSLERLIAECVKVRLVRRYVVGGKPYLVIEKFGQRVRADQSRYPAPPETDECPSDDRHLTVIRPAEDGPPRTETKAETETETKARERRGRAGKESPPSEEEWVTYARETWPDWPEHDVRAAWAHYEARKWKGDPVWQACAKTCYHRQAGKAEGAQLRALVGAHRPIPKAQKPREVDQESPLWVIGVAKALASPLRPAIPDELEVAYGKWRRSEAVEEPPAWREVLEEAFREAAEEDRRMAGGRGGR